MSNQDQAHNLGLLPLWGSPSLDFAVLNSPVLYFAVFLLNSIHHPPQSAQDTAFFFAAAAVGR